MVLLFIVVFSTIIIIIIIIIIEIPVSNANSIDPDQRLHSTTSDLGLHGLQMSLLWDTGHK